MGDSPSLAAPKPVNEPHRLRALAAYEILDTPYEGDFDDIARLASQICDTPIAVVNLIDQGRQWFKAEVGLGVRETPLDSSICAHAILQPTLFEIPDTLLDTRFNCNPLVTGEPHLRFYAGAPLRTPDGFQLGTVCVLDRRPRQLAPEQQSALLALARQTMALMELRRALRIADSTQKQLRRLMVTAGHDLRQPLQLITLGMEVARLRAHDPSVVMRQTKGVLDAVAQLGTGLDALALASSAAAGFAEPDISRFPVQERFDHLRKMWAPQAERKGLRLRFAPCSAQVMSDAQLLDTILGNLIGNAVKYTESGRVLVGCRRRSGKLRIDVIDTGVGMAPDQQATMFEAFRKADIASDGLGLGLSIVRNTAELLELPIDLQSAPSQGTRISVTLPLAS